MPNFQKIVIARFLTNSFVQVVFGKKRSLHDFFVGLTQSQDCKFAAADHSSNTAP